MGAVNEIGNKGARHGGGEEERRREERRTDGRRDGRTERRRDGRTDGQRDGGREGGREAGRDGGIRVQVQWGHTLLAHLSAASRLAGRERPRWTVEIGLTPGFSVCGCCGPVRARRALRALWVLCVVPCAVCRPSWSFCTADACLGSLARGSDRATSGHQRLLCSHCSTADPRPVTNLGTMGALQPAHCCGAASVVLQLVACECRAAVTVRQHTPHPVTNKGTMGAQGQIRYNAIVGSS